MREYETVFVLHPNLDDARVEEEIEGVKQTIVSASGEVLDVERWGRRRLAYSINKVHEGIYTLVRFSSGPEVVGLLERRYRLREDILRHLTVLSHGRPAEPVHRHEDGAEQPDGLAADTRTGEEAQTPVTEGQAAEPVPASSPAQGDASAPESA